MRNLFLVFSCLLVLIISSCSTKNSSYEANPGQYIIAPKVGPDFRLDGQDYDAVWKQSEWRPLDHFWLGEKCAPEDFSGEYKVAWDIDYIYVFARITDDRLVDNHPDGLVKYWDDDCMEIFIDADHSGGDHQYNHNAFAYHVAIDKKVVDMGKDKQPHYYNDHVVTIRRENNNVYNWEMAIQVFDQTYKEDNELEPREFNIPERLSAGRKLGFMLAYCDNDYSEERENFIGSVAIPGEDKDRGWIDASVFGTLELVELEQKEESK